MFEDRRVTNDGHLYMWHEPILCRFLPQLSLLNTTFYVRHSRKENTRYTIFTEKFPVLLTSFRGLHKEAWDHEPPFNDQKRLAYYYSGFPNEAFVKVEITQMLFKWKGHELHRNAIFWILKFTVLIIRTSPDTHCVRFNFGTVQLC